MVRRHHHGRAVVLALATVVAPGGLGGCDEPAAPRLVAQRGCDLDDDRIGTLRVEARGDFVPGAGTQVVFSGGESSLLWGDRLVDGVTVEGLFGQRVEVVGRTARIHDDGDVPVYFAPVDGVCAVPGALAPRTEVAAAVGALGDVVIVGGRDAAGRLLDDVLTLHDEVGELAMVEDRLPFPSTGQTVHALGERRFVVLGGAGSNPTALGHGVIIDLEQESEPVGDPITIAAEPELDPARAFHAAARLGDERILVVGGCKQLTPDARCAVADALGSGSLPQRALWLTVGDDSIGAQVGPDVAVPRYGAWLLVARDDVAFLVGGRDAEGMPVHIVERLRPDTTRFRPYGGDLRSSIDDTMPVTGAGLLEGGVVVLALADGRVHWLHDGAREEYRPWRSWCDDEAPCFRDMGEPFVAQRRGAVVLPGQRLLLDGALLPIGGLGRDGEDVLDLFATGLAGATVPSWRVDTRPIALADGSVVLVGGYDPRDGTLAEPLAVRVRPDLDGPDERIPAVDRSAPGSLVARDLDRVVLEGEAVRFLADEGADVVFPQVRAQVRGFRSTRFRFEATVQVGVGEVVPHIVLEHGAVEAVSIALGPERIEGHLRDPQSRLQTVSCAVAPLDFSSGVVLSVDVRPAAITIRADGELAAECPTFSEGRPWSVGIGAAGSGEMVASSLRLRRQ